MVRLLKCAVAVLAALALCAPVMAQDDAAKTKEQARTEGAKKVQELREKAGAAELPAKEKTPVDPAKVQEAIAKIDSERQRDRVKTAVEMTKADANARKDDLRDDMALATQRATQIATSIRTGVLTPDEAKAITAKDKALSQLAAQLKPDAKPSAEERTQLLQHFSDVLGLVCKAKQEGGVALAMKKALKAKIESGAVLGAEAKDLVQKMRTMCSLRQTLAAAQGQVSAEKTKVLTDLRQLIMGLTE